MSEYEKLPPDTMTVIIRDDAPIVFSGDSPSYRSVRIKLTQEQRKALILSGSYDCGNIIWEDISRVIIEEIKDQ